MLIGFIHFGVPEILTKPPCLYIQSHMWLSSDGKPQNHVSFMCFSGKPCFLGVPQFRETLRLMGDSWGVEKCPNLTSQSKKGTFTNQWRRWWGFTDHLTQTCWLNHVKPCKVRPSYMLVKINPWKLVRYIQLINPNSSPSKKSSRKPINFLLVKCSISLCHSIYPLIN